MPNRILLTQLPAALIEAGYHDAPSYRTAYEMARDGRLPSAKPNKSGRWTFDPEALPEIATALDLTDAHAA